VPLPAPSSNRRLPLPLFPRPGLLRTEIAVLKLVNHPNIIKLEGLYESKNYIYIVMEMLKGGELFERIVGKPR
jgi:serine/threonine protein kinase